MKLVDLLALVDFSVYIAFILDGEVYSEMSGHPVYKYIYNHSELYIVKSINVVEDDLYIEVEQ